MVQWATAVCRGVAGGCSPISVLYLCSPRDPCEGDTRRKAAADKRSRHRPDAPKTYDDAANRVRGSHLTDPGNPHTVTTSATSEYKTEDFESAVRFCGEAIEADPSAPSPTVNRDPQALVRLQPSRSPQRITPSSSSSPTIQNRSEVRKKSKPAAFKIAALPGRIGHRT